MSHKLQPVRGTKDILPEEYRAFHEIGQVAREVGSYYGFQGMATPIFEFTEVFARTLGDVSDIVNKEMYSFEDRGGEGITLRPEFTAGIVRSVISQGLLQHIPLKLFSMGPVFRYERPQKGRQRQFHQINFECFGLADAKADVEILALLMQLVHTLGIQKKVELEINSLGDQASREKYRELLTQYLEKYRTSLSEESQLRLVRNPLRILDSKDEKDKVILTEAPSIAMSYSKEASAFFSEVQEGLTILGIPHKVNPRLVRGLDYYCHTAFECTTSFLGSQNAVFAGGRYDGLVKAMGGPEMPAIGFAGGIERIIALMEKKFAAPIPVAIIPVEDGATKQALLLAQQLRGNGICTEILYNGNIGKRIRKAADKMQAELVVILGEKEMMAGEVTVRSLSKSKEITIKQHDIVRYMRHVMQEVVTVTPEEKE